MRTLLFSGGVIAHQFSPDGTKLAVLLAVDFCPEVANLEVEPTNKLCWGLVKLDAPCCTNGIRGQQVPVKNKQAEQSPTAREGRGRHTQVATEVVEADMSGVQVENSTPASLRTLDNPCPCHLVLATHLFSPLLWASREYYSFWEQYIQTFQIWSPDSTQIVYSTR
jgi:hypothetical protein